MCGEINISVLTFLLKGLNVIIIIIIYINEPTWSANQCFTCWLNIDRL